ncbi:MAG TPA: ABC transporter transmembrane domain-containing protein, partial [Sumerlaeia bacterium]|nr:ABC transporter transmembrane domain-containing protein [Sumerlaeia bacterium]
MGVFDNEVSLSRVPPDVRAQAQAAGLDEAACLFCVRSDLTLDRRKCDAWLVVTRSAAATLSADGAGDGLLAGPFELGKIEKVRTFQTVGSAFLQFQMDGAYVDVARYSNARREIFDRAAKEIDRVLKGEPEQLDALLRPSDLVCNKCGLPLPSRKTPCPRCRATRGLFFRTVGLMKAYYGYVLLLLLFSVCSVGIEQLPPQITRTLIDEVLAPPQNASFPVTHMLFGETPAEGSNARLLVWILLALLGIHAVTQFLGVINGRMSAWIGTRITFELRETLQNKLMDISVDYHDRHSAGSLMSRVLYDVEYFQSFVQQVAQGLLVNLFRVVAIGSILFYMNWELALYVLIPIPISAVCTTLFWRFLYPCHYRYVDSRSKLSRLLSGLYSGVRLVKAFAQEKRENERFDEASGYMKDSARSLLMNLATFNPFIGFLFSLGGIAVWYLGGHSVLDGGMSLGVLQAFILYVFMFYAPVTALSAFSNWISGFVTAGQRVFEVLDSTSAVPIDPHPVSPPQPRGEIEFRNVTFGYDAYNPVLNNINLKIEPGEFIGIVGKS